MNSVGPSNFNPVGSGKFATPSSKHLSSVSRLILHLKSPFSLFARFVMRKSRRDFSLMMAESFSSATFLPWCIVKSLDISMDRIALRKSGMSVLLVPIGETGEMSTTINRSTSCGYFRAKYIIARPPIEWPRIAALLIFLSLRNFAMSSDIKLYECWLVWGESPWFLASMLMIFLEGFEVFANALQRLFLKTLCNGLKFSSSLGCLCVEN